MEVTARDERGHGAAGMDTVESWTFEFVTADGALGGWVRYSTVGDAHAWYEAIVVGPHRPLLAVIDHDVPLRSSPMEVRTHGLWADHICETPLDHWTLGLEAFAVSLDDPDDLSVDARGDLVPLGLDLEWETDGPVVALESTRPGYHLPCRVTGEILVGTAAIDLDAVGWRDHRWGPAGWPTDRGLTLRAVLEGGRSILIGPDALDTGDVKVEELRCVPIPMPSGAATSRTRSLCRVWADGRCGIGWLDRDAGAFPVAGRLTSE